MPNNLPNLIIAGVHKAGTTSLYAYLSAHSDICASNVKETCYFHAMRYGYQMQPIEVYTGYFSHCECEQYILEATPGYFYGGNAVASAIRNMLGDIRIILCFREPVSRFISFYKYHKSVMNLPQSMTLDEYIERCESMPLSERRLEKNSMYWGINGGMYGDYIEDWFDVFGNSIYVTYFDQLKDDSQPLLKELCEWLEIDGSTYDVMGLGVENRSVDYRNRYLHRLARTVNTRGEQFWRRNLHIKHALRGLYYRFNGREFAEQYPESALDYLRTLYEPSNQQLARCLRNRGYSNLPQWLALSD